MEFIAKDMDGNPSKIKINDLVEVSGIVFVVTTIDLKPKKIVLTPANESLIKQYQNTTKPQDVVKPKLTKPKPAKKPEPEVDPETEAKGENPEEEKAGPSFPSFDKGDK